MATALGDVFEEALRQSLNGFLLLSLDIIQVKHENQYQRSATNVAATVRMRNKLPDIGLKRALLAQD